MWASSCAANNTQQGCAGRCKEKHSFALHPNKASDHLNRGQEEAAAKQSDCTELLPWIKAITNHMYGAATSSDGNKELIVPKWKCLLNHIQGIHEHDNELFPSCLHGHIEPREWLKKDFRALQNLKELATARTLLKDMPHLSTKYQTYGLEAFHSLLLHFAPKLYHYPRCWY